MTWPAVPANTPAAFLCDPGAKHAIDDSSEPTLFRGRL
jgi:hypothetical protein